MRVNKPSFEAGPTLADGSDKQEMNLTLGMNNLNGFYAQMAVMLRLYCGGAHAEASTNALAEGRVGPVGGLQRWFINSQQESAQYIL